MALTETWLKANHKKLRDKAFEKTDRDGLSVRLSPKGKVTYTLPYQYFGKAGRVDIGSYPLMSLKEARTEAQRLKKKLEQGHDPKVIRLVEKQAIAGASTLNKLFTDWYQSYCTDNKKNHHEIKRSFELHVLPKLGKLPVEKITLHQWLDIVEEQAKIRPGIADRILTNSKQLMKWAVKRQLIPVNVLSDINAKEDLQIKKNEGSRSLSDEEIKLVWCAIEKSRMSLKNKIFLKLCLMYGCRNGELRQAKKSHFDFSIDVWTVPPENHKLGKTTGKPLIRPITEGAKALLQEVFALSVKSEFVFTNSGSDQPMGQGAPLALPYNIMQYLRRHMDYNMAHWSVHDLRKTARTNFSRLTEAHIAEVLLGHTIGGNSVWRVYDHYDYLEEQKKALNNWSARLTELTQETTSV